MLTRKFAKCTSRGYTLRGLLLLVPLLAIPAIAQALPLPDAKYTGYGVDPGDVAPLSGPGGAGNAYTDPTGGLDSSSFSISLAGTPTPAAYASIVSTYNPYGGVSASAGVIYYMEIIDGTSSTSHNPVTLDVAAFLSASSFGDGTGGSVFQIQQTSYISGSTACSEGAPCLVQSWATCAAEDPFLCAAGAPVSETVNTTESLLSNTEYTVQLAASAGLNPLIPTSGPYARTQSGTAGGFVDPSFQIDASTASASDFSIAFSSGIGNAAPVPEPSTYGFMITGVGVVAAVVCLRKLA
ncbi:MAG: PEP-CTERM sorting domain-containing protein [Thiobacillaceae bacterium]